MKIALAQLNYTVNDFELNTHKIIEAVEQAKQNNAELVIFSELAVCGGVPEDLLTRSNFANKCLASIEEIATHCNGIAAIVGGTSKNANLTGKPLYNAAFFLKDGKIESIHNKSLLSTYDVFDEHRYFEPSHNLQTATLRGKTIVITIGEDVWDDQPASSETGERKLYSNSPMQKLITHKPDLVVNLAALPFACGNINQRLSVYKGSAKRFGIPLISVNQIGGNTNLIFDGRSLAINSNGTVAKMLAVFEEDISYVNSNDLEANATSISIEAANTTALIHDALVLGVRDFFTKMGFTKATLGLSGGIDSAVTLALAQKALDSENIRVLLLPSQYSTEHSVSEAVELAEHLNIQYDVINISSVFNSFRSSLAPIFEGQPENLTEENMQARTRGVMLMALSNKFGHLLLNTSNKSEAAVGYGTLYGDMCGALMVLGDVYKTEVYNLARYINRDEEIIPTNTITKPPSAELRPDQKDSDSLPDYDILDGILYEHIEENKSEEEIVQMGYDAQQVSKTIRLVKISEHKRFQSPPILRVSSKSFGNGRRIPLVAKI